MATSGFDSYQWQLNGANITGATSAQYNAQNAGAYSVLITESNCPATSIAINVQVIALPIVSIVPDENVVACADNYLLNANSTGSIQWLMNGVEIVGAVQNNYTATQNGDYSFASDNNGLCEVFSDEISVVLNSEYSIEIIATDTMPCAGDVVHLNVAGNYDSLQWSDGTNGNSVSITENGNYSATALAGDCNGSASITINFTPMPEVDAGKDAASDCNTGAILTGSGTGTLHWETSASLLDAASDTTIANPSTTTTYTLVAQDGNCISEDEVIVQVDCNSIYVPNTFTPNGDGINDRFEIHVKWCEEFSSAHLQPLGRSCV